MWPTGRDWDYRQGSRASLTPAQVAGQIKTLEQRMYQHARDLEFEAAASVRDQLRRLREASIAG